MSNTSKYLPSAARRQEILALIEHRGFVRVSMLAEYFEISEVTVRSDLEALAATNSIQRVHGGAVAGLSSTSIQRTFNDAAKEASAEKTRIGAAAANLVKTHQVIFLDVGTTSTSVARALARRDDIVDITVVTNALNIALELEGAYPRLTVIVTGGTLRPAQHSLVDPMADMLFGRIRADIAFVSCNGVSVDAGVTNLSFSESDMKRRMLQSANRRIVVADSTKLGVVRSSRVSSLRDIDLLITGKEASPNLLDHLRKAGLEVLTA